MLLMEYRKRVAFIFYPSGSPLPPPLSLASLGHLLQILSAEFRGEFDSMQFFNSAFIIQYSAF
jgi:hypothetical protein